ncbi:MAG: Rossmann fold nucleotide-binding protein [Halohasta sp.]
MHISVIGSGSELDAETAADAEAVGRLVAERGHTLVCGGMGGVMAAACRGARSAGGETIGILPVDDPAAANEYVTTPIATGMGHARNVLVPLNGDAVIAITGAGGTLSELGFAAVYDRPVAGLRTHDLPWIEAVDTPEAAVDYAEAAAES